MLNPLVGVWFETIFKDFADVCYTVTPHVGVWIETLAAVGSFVLIAVTPHVGVWIETSVAVLSDAAALSHPMRECELKPFVSCRSNMPNWKTGVYWYTF